MSPANSSSTELPWESSPPRELLRLSWPMVVSLLSVGVASLLDTLFVGQLGAVPLAAVGLGGVATFTVLSFGLAVFSAAKVEVGEALGRGDRGSIDRSLSAFSKLAWPLGLLSTLVAFLAAQFVLRNLGDEETGRLAAEYTTLRALSFPVALAVGALASWLQAQGKPRAPMLAALGAVVVHVPLNAWFIFGLDFGVRGLAVASVLSQLVEAALLFAWVRPWSKQLGSASWAEAWHALRLGFPTGAERVLDMAAFAAVPLLLAQVGSVAVASHQITLQLVQFSFLPLLALSDGGAILVSQAVGADRHGLVSRVAKASVSMAFVYGAGLAAIFFFGRYRLVNWFTSDPAVISSAALTLSAGALLQLVNGTYNALKGVLRGLSQFRFVARVTVGVAWVITPPLTYVFGVRLRHGAPGAWFVLCLEVSIGTLLTAHRVLGELGWRGLGLRTRTSSS